LLISFPAVLAGIGTIAALFAVKIGTKTITVWLDGLGHVL
jgi:hypothetical protein